MFYPFINSQNNQCKFLLVPQLRIYSMCWQPLILVGVYRSPTNPGAHMPIFQAVKKSKKNECGGAVYMTLAHQNLELQVEHCAVKPQLSAVFAFWSVYEMVSHLHEYFYNSVYISNYNLGSLT